MDKKYYIGLDVGTDSCGWAVTDESYNIKRFKGNAMWGIRLFDESKTAADRRSFRASRRRLDRRGDRLRWLDSVFAEEINKIDPEFFIRLRESGLHFTDKSVQGKYALFSGSYTDKEFHKDYPTAYHLRLDLIKNGASHDVRFVYLALHHIIKYRGHFLFEELNVQEINDFGTVFEDFIRYCKDNYGDENGDNPIDFTTHNIAELEKIVRNRTVGKATKKNELAKLYNASKKSAPQLLACLGLLAGCKEKLSDVFADDVLKEAEKNGISFSDGYSENEEAYAAILGERFELIEKLKAVYDWGVLADIRQGEKYISAGMVKKYQDHHRDLKQLKAYVRAYFSKAIYTKIFKLSKEKLCNYVVYSGHIKDNGKTGVLAETATQEEFCAYLKKTLGECKDEAYQNMFQKIFAGTFCPKPRSADNGVIPMQLHRMELVKILEHASSYLPFLSAPDENGITAMDKIIDIFDYKIPYYVGPLNNSSGKYWVKRKDGQVYPWNVQSIVDYDASAEAFIDNLTNQCTYLPQYDVLPKNSILFSKFSVLNEINSLKIDGEPITVQLKQEIFNELFLKRAKVSRKAICGLLKSKNIPFTTLTGIDEEIKSNMKSYRDLDSFSALTVSEKDDIIKAITVFGEEKKLLKKRLREKYGDRLSDTDIGYLAKLNYSGWGRLSEEFLTEVVSVDKETGELVNIVTALWQTNMNLMQLLYSDRFEFENALKEAAEGNHEDSLRKAVENLYVSPKIKRPIYQTLLIVKELVKTQGAAPEKIFLEVAKGAAEKKRTKSRKVQLEELYAACKKDYAQVWSELCEIQDADRLKSDKLFLYFTQCGKCMYTGEQIDLGELMGSNSRWDIDHIYPQSKIKDDSLHNNRVLAKKEYNSKVKGPRYPLPADTQAEMSGFWKYLLDKGLINEEKYNRLICRQPLTEEQLSAFISRQLVETRQSTKAIAGVLQELYPKTEIVYVKAGLVSDFRQENGFIKSRDVNDLHHAKDAYLNIVVGNVYNVQCTHNKVNFIKGLQSDERDSYSMNGMFRFNIVGAWDRQTSMKTVKTQMAKNNILYTRYSFKQKGELFKRQPVKKGKGQIPLQATGPRSRMDDYGAYSSAATYCYCLAKHGKPGKEKVGLFAINLYEKERYYAMPSAYLHQRYGLLDPVVLLPEINIQACLSFDGFRVHLGGKDSGGANVVYRPAVQLVVDTESEHYIKKIFKFFERNKGNKSPLATSYDGITKEDNFALYNLLIQKMQNKIYGVMFKDLANKLENAADEFEKLSVEAQGRILWELVNILHCNASGGDLKAINIAANGKIRKGRNISENGFSSIKLIHQSVTGLYEHQVDLLNM